MSDKIPRTRAPIGLLAALALSGWVGACTTVRSTPECKLSERDQAWLDRAIEAWRFASREIAGIETDPTAQAIFFNADCVLRSANALTRTRGGATWTATPHAGTIALPDGTEIPAGVTSYASGDNGLFYFVMSTPTVWEAAKVGEGEQLERMMVGVFLHEASHLAQIGPYGKRLGALIERYKLPDSFSDDSMQHRFQSNAEFEQSIKEETRLFLAAAAAENLGEAKKLARQARVMMRARQARWFTGEDVYFTEAEDIWLTFEGAGQWIGYQWLIHPRGGKQPPDQPRFTKGRWWSQNQGFAVVAALHRIAGPGWRRQAWGDGAKTILQMLDDALQD